ncbi:WD40 repeat-like protein [Auriscalpium vulgare]|uniref:WD40 repeat-like protein n=1 Tax=Auriscalpium vulgare TaxID=40419 RepID=A0ACB8RKR2_9AGAM|nr:WD40 repeat-like protein [Auriscalpium vulgare]
MSGTEMHQRTVSPSTTSLASSTTETPREGLPGKAGQFVGTEKSTESKGPSCKCKPLPDGKHGRNLVLCIDGTSNRFSLKNTNVLELYSRLHKDESQLTYYSSGVGASVKESSWTQKINQTIDTAIAWNFKEIVLDAYQWLCENYQPGDRIFLFGFSRGAYQVRVIAGMIEKVGLLHKGHNSQIPFAYEHYVSITRSQTGSTSVPPTEQDDDIKSPKDPGYAERLCSSFKQTMSQKDVRVHFVGVWDTVSSIWFARDTSLPETTTGMLHVCACRHALALDENRVKFQPELVNGGNGPLSKDSRKGDVKEVWFSGSHSDVGGGNIPNLELRHFGAPLRWMSYEGITHGLRLLPWQGIQWKSFKPNPSLTGFWKVLEYYPFRQLSYKDGDSTIRRPHLGRARQVTAGQKIHESVFENIEKGDYTPLAHLPRGVHWERQALEHLNMLEGDAYASATITLSQLKTNSQNNQRLSPEHQNSLTTLASTAIGRDSLATAAEAGDILFHALSLEHEYADTGRRSLNITALIGAIVCLRSRPPASKKVTKARLLELVSVLADVPENSKIRRDFMEVFRETQTFCGHQDEVNSVCFSADGKRVVSGSDDGTIRVWDARTGQMVGGPFIGHTRAVRSVAFSLDGALVVSGSLDGTIRIWNAQTGEMVAGPFTEHTESVLSVAFSFDGGRVVSGSSDETIRIWHARSGKMVAGPFKGHSDSIQSVAFSPDGTQIVSGSRDETIRVWDPQTGDTVAGPFKGHTSVVRSVAFSPDGKRVVSGSSDNTVQVWDAPTGRTLAGPFTGHKHWVQSVAFSPDGKYIISGSNDETIRIWDSHTGKTMARPFTGHTGWVLSVAYSPDGMLVASGSVDGTVRIWDASDIESSVI